jgi:hypothetical protein
MVLACGAAAVGPDAIVTAPQSSPRSSVDSGVASPSRKGKGKGKKGTGKGKGKGKGKGAKQSKPAARAEKLLLGMLNLIASDCVTPEEALRRTAADGATDLDFRRLAKVLTYLGAATQRLTQGSSPTAAAVAQSSTLALSTAVLPTTQLASSRTATGLFASAMETKPPVGHAQSLRQMLRQKKRGSRTGALY